MMRDPNRIPRMLKKLGDLWISNPDWRFGQLVSNTMIRPEPEALDAQRFFYQEDEETEQQLDVAVTRYVKPTP